jgi:hypothetical protein
MIGIRTKIILLLVLSLLFLFPVAAFSQKFLALEKHGRIKRLRFFANDKINVRLKEESFFRSGYIDAFTDSSFFLDGENISLQRVDAVLVHKTKGGHALIRQLVYYLPAGGIFITGLAATNSVINNESPLVPKKTIYTASGMAVTGLLLYPLTFRVYRTKKHPLKIIDVTISPK